MNSNPHVTVVGATGAVGVEMIKTLEKRNFPVGKLTLLASARSVGKKLKFRGQEVPVSELTEDSFAGVDIALFSAGGGISKEFAPHAVNAGCVVVDNSSAFRMDDEVPLVVPEINAADINHAPGHHRQSELHHRDHSHGALPAAPGLHVKRIFASSYQAVSGTGAQAIEELERQVRRVAGKPVSKKVIRTRSPSTPCRTSIPSSTGYTKEEMKMQNEGRKIMHHPAFRASVTCVRVPVYRAHSVAVSAEFEKPVSLEAAREVLDRAPGLDVVDDPAKKKYPLPLDVAEKTTARWAASAWTAPWTTAFASGSWATNSSRAPR